MKRLLLDDERSSKQIHGMTKNQIYLKKWEIVKTFDEFVKYIDKNELPDVISFDHDLGEGKNGMDCLKYLINKCMDNNLELPAILVHSMNPVGRDNLINLVKSFNKRK